MSSTLYRIIGLNFKKFINELKKNNITILQLRKLDYNQFEIMVDNQKKFLTLCKTFNYQVDEIKLTKKETIFRKLKQNFIFVLIAIVLCFSLIFSSNFVFKIEISGLESVQESDILAVLKNNGYEAGKIKSKYDLDNLESVLVKNIDKISFATGVIKGSTLVVNIYEKIDNSPYIYDYLPIFAPFDCVVKEILLTSGTIKISQSETAKEGDVIVAPYIEAKDFKRLPVPAKATIKAYVEIKETAQIDTNLTNAENLIEETKKKLYNKLSSKVKSYTFDEEILQDNGLITVKLCGEVEF